MPSGKTHEKVNKLFLIPALLLLGHYISFDAEGIIFSILFIIKWWWNTYRFTPDRDIKSRATRRAKITGKPINWLFKHGGTLHNPLFWGVIFAVEYSLFGWWTLGGVFPVYSHLILDKVF